MNVDPARAMALRPPQLSDEALATCTWSGLDAQPDGIFLTLIRVEPDAGGASLQRQVWCFDPEQHSWELDEQAEWPLPAAAVAPVCAALGGRTRPV